MNNSNTPFQKIKKPYLYSIRFMRYLTLLYYKYTNIPEPEIFAKRHLKFCKELGLKGRVLIAQEGINGTVSGTAESCRHYMDTLQADPAFAGIEFKIDEVDQVSFTKIHVRPKKEIVAFGDSDQKIDPARVTGVHLEPKDFQKIKEEKD